MPPLPAAVAAPPGLSALLPDDPAPEPRTYSSNVTIGEIPAHSVTLDLQRRGSELARIFRDSPALPGVILTENDIPVSVISRQHFLQMVGRQYGVELYHHRPVRVLLPSLGPAPLVLPADCPVPDAVERCLRRPQQQLYDPVLIRFAPEAGGHTVLADFHALLLAHASVSAQIESERAQALAASDAKSLFLANMSHELRTPLNAIIGYSEMLLEEAQSGDMCDCSEDLAKIRDAGAHLLRIISDILDMSKIESGKLHLAQETLPILPILEDVISLIAPAAQSNRNTLRLLPSPDTRHLHLRTDPLRLRQILINLLGNACKFTQGGQVTLRTTLDPDRPELLLTVTDTGIGIAPEHLPNLFQPFTQADPSMTRLYGGTGLGLAISHRLAAHLGGSITVQSQLAQGSTFILRHPIHSE